MSFSFSMTHDEVVAKLQSLLDDPSMVTESHYTPNTIAYPEGRVSFIDYHLAYLSSHKHVNPSHYISNLELMIKKR